MTAEGEIDLEYCKADPVTGVSAAGNRTFVLRAELEAELVEAGFEVLEMVFKTPPGEVPTGDMLNTFARKA